MPTTISQLICQLNQLKRKYGNLEMIVEPYIADADSCRECDIAYDAIHNQLKPLTTRIVEAQSSRDEDQALDDDTEYYLDYFEAPLDKKKLLVISSKYFRHG